MNRAPIVLLMSALLASAFPSGGTAQERGRREPFGSLSPVADLRDRAEKAYEAGRFNEAVARQKERIEHLPTDHYERRAAWGRIAVYCREAGRADAMISALINAREYEKAARELDRAGLHAEAVRLLLTSKSGDERRFWRCLRSAAKTGQERDLQRVRTLAQRYLDAHPDARFAYEPFELRFLLDRPELGRRYLPVDSLRAKDAEEIGRWAREKGDTEAATWADYLDLAVHDVARSEGDRRRAAEAMAEAARETAEFCRRHPASPLAFHALFRLDWAEARLPTAPGQRPAYQIALDVLPDTPERFGFVLRLAQAGRAFTDEKREELLRQLLAEAKSPRDARAARLALMHRISRNPERGEDLWPLCRELLQDPDASDADKAAAMEYLRRSFFRPRELDFSESVMDFLEKHVDPTLRPAELVTRHADLLRRAMQRDEAVAFLRSFLARAPDHPDGAAILRKLAHHMRVRDPVEYEKCLLATASHPCEGERDHRAQRAATEELAAFYEQTGRFKDAARVLERYVPSRRLRRGIDRGGLERRLRVLGHKLQFMAQDDVLDAMWRLASGSAYRSASEARLAAFYLVRAYDSEGRGGELADRASAFAASAEPRRAQYARTLCEEIKRLLERRDALRGDAPIIVSELANGAERWLPSLIAPPDASRARERGWELVQALRRFPKEPVAFLLAENFRDGPRNDWMVLAMVENGNPRLLSLLLDAAKTVPDKRGLEKYIGAIAYTAVPGAEEMILDIAAARNDLDNPIIADALAYLADLRDRRSAAPTNAQPPP